jgi:hypothetical protein
MTAPVPQAEGGDAHGNPRPGIGLSEAQRDRTLVGDQYGAAPPHEEPEAPENVDEAYADHIHNHRVGDYPPVGPPPPTKAQLDETLARNRVDPGSAQKRTFVKLAEYEDASGKPLPSSPIERLRQDLQRLQGETGGRSLKVRLTLAALSDHDMGAWEAAADLKATTDKAQGTLNEAIERIYSVYSGVVRALDDTIQAAKRADQSIASGVKKA